MVLDATLLNIQHYEVGIKTKVENPGNGVGPPLHLGVVANEKGAFGHPRLRSPTLLLGSKIVLLHIMVVCEPRV